MAKEAIAKFMEAAVTDRSTAEKVSALAAKCGYAFTADELLAVEATQEMSDDEIEEATGGSARPNVMGLARTRFIF